jgi:hypothetical protein
MGLVGGAYQIQLLWPLLFAGPSSAEGPLQLILLVPLGIGLVAALPIISMGGAVSLLILPMSDEHRGILAFFVMLSSLFPIMALALNLLKFTSSLLAVWPFLIFAMVWVVLISMVAKALRHRELSRAEAQLVG